MNRLLSTAHQLSVIDVRVLEILASSNDGSARMGDLASSLAVTRRQMTKRIDRLQARVLVRREPDLHDRRGVAALVTETGRFMIEQAKITYAQGVARYLLDPLTARQVTTVAENCWRINEGLSNPDRQGVGDESIFPEAPACSLPGIDDAGKRCWHQFLESSEALFPAMSDRLMDAQQLTLICVLLLDQIAKSPGGSGSMSMLGELFALMPSRVTQEISRLEYLGLVNRVAGQGDRRTVFATITALGRARVGQARVAYAGEIRRKYLDSMSHRQAIALGDACRRISIALKCGAERPA